MSYVRDGQLVWPYCTSCGRRLRYDIFRNMVAFTHFYSTPEEGCSDRFETFWEPVDSIWGKIAHIVDPA